MCPALSCTENKIDKSLPSWNKYSMNRWRRGEQELRGQAVWRWGWREQLIGCSSRGVLAEYNVKKSVVWHKALNFESDNLSLDTALRLFLSANWGTSLNFFSTHLLICKGKMMPIFSYFSLRLKIWDDFTFLTQSSLIFSSVSKTPIMVVASKLF